MKIFKEYDPLTRIGMRIGSLCILAGFGSILFRMFLISVSIAWEMQGLFQLLIAGMLLILAGGLVYFLTGIKNTITWIVSKDEWQKRKSKEAVIKCSMVVAAIAGMVALLAAVNS